MSEEMLDMMQPSKTAKLQNYHPIKTFVIIDKSEAMINYIIQELSII